MSLTLAMLIVLTISGVVMSGAMLLFRLLPAERFRLHNDDKRKVATAKLYQNAAINSVLSPLIFLGSALGFHQVFFAQEPVSIARGALQALSILLLYDFLYYLLHRYPFHQWKLLQRVHSVHHQIKEPTALDALYIHPLETALGVSLFMACVWVVGPVHPYAFVAAFFVHSQLNILIHSGLKLPSFALRPISYMAKKHNAHHASMRSGNYASITPIPDLIFGTAE